MFLFQVQFHSVSQSCPTLWDPMDWSTPGFPDHHQLPKPTQTNVHQVRDSVQPSHPLSSPTPPAFPASGSVPVSQFFTSGCQSIGVSPLASVLPMNIQEWFPLGWTGWISLQSKGLSRVISNTTFKSINSYALSFLCSPILTSIHDYRKNHSFENTLLAK